MLVREKILAKDNDKTLIIRANNKTVFDGHYNSYDVLKRYLDCEVIEEHIGDTVHGLNIKLNKSIYK